MTKVKPFADQIRELRAQLNFSQEQLASRLNVSFATVNRWEGGKAKPQRVQLDAVEKLMDEAGFNHSDAEHSAEGRTNTVQGRRRRGTSKSTVLGNKGMEQMLWDAACSIRGEKDAPKFKDYILPLLFIKRLSDVFDDEIQRLSETYGERKTALEVLENDHSLVRFYVPPEARWPVVSNREPFKWPKGKEPKSLGEQLTTTIRAIVKHNPSLAGVIDIVDYNETRNGEREISDAALRGIIETFSDPRYRLGLHDVKPDFLGDCYEYLLRKFAEGQGQSAGEFFTPMEVGFLMAHILRPRAGEECYDYACGSFGLLIKLQLVSRMIDPLSKVPLKLYGQELTGSSYAIACMNKIIHDMDGQIVRGDSLRNPKFKDGDTRLKKFDIVVANPMWNQPFDADVFENDPFERFEEQGGVTTSKGDWAWLQHTLASLKDTGRAAVVLDTQAATRGSGSKNEDKERNIRKWFIEQDYVDGVILLPPNLFYNTPAAGIIVLLRKQKPRDRKNKIVMVNASACYEKGDPKNFISETDIRRISAAFVAGKPVQNLLTVISTSEAAEKDYNLSPALYVSSHAPTRFAEVGDAWKTLMSVEDQQYRLFERAKPILERLAKLMPTTGLNGTADIGTIRERLPRGWRLSTIGAECTKPQYGLTARATSNPSGPKFLRITDISEKGVDWSTVPSCECNDDAAQHYGLLHNDIVFARIGATTGKSYIIKNPPRAVFASYLIKIRAKDGLDPDYLIAFLNSDLYWRQVAANKGNNLKGGINGTVLSAMHIVVPPKPEQRVIAHVLTSVRDLVDVQNALKSAGQEVFRATLQRLLNAEIRITDLDIDLSEAKS